MVFSFACAAAAVARSSGRDARKGEPGSLFDAITEAAPGAAHARRRCRCGTPSRQDAAHGAAAPVDTCERTSDRAHRARRAAAAAAESGRSQSCEASHPGSISTPSGRARGARRGGETRRPVQRSAACRRGDRIAAAPGCACVASSSSRSAPTSSRSARCSVRTADSRRPARTMHSRRSNGTAACAADGSRCVASCAVIPSRRVASIRCPEACLKVAPPQLALRWTPNG